MNSPRHDFESRIELPARATDDDWDVAPPSSIYRGMLLALPLSALLWFGIIWMIRSW